MGYRIFLQTVEPRDVGTAYVVAEAAAYKANSTAARFGEPEPAARSSQTGRGRIVDG
jgi:hypothetical protein